MSVLAKKAATTEQKKRDLYLRQKKELLATLLEHGAISQAQHDKSLGDLGMKPSSEPND